MRPADQHFGWPSGWGANTNANGTGRVDPNRDGSRSDGDLPGEHGDRGRDSHGNPDGNNAADSHGDPHCDHPADGHFYKASELDRDDGPADFGGNLAGSRNPDPTGCPPPEHGWRHFGW